MQLERRRLPVLSGSSLGAVLLTVAVALFTVEFLLARRLAADLSPAQIAFARFSIQLLVMAPLLVRRRGAVFRTARYPMHLLRSAGSAVSMALAYVSFAHLPVAVATTLSFTQVIFVALLAAPWLGERLGAARIGAALAGFVGVVMVARPGLDGVEPAMLAALVAAVTGAITILATRSLGRTEGPFTTMAWVAVNSTALLLIPTLLLWRPVAAEQVLPLLGVAACGIVGQYLVVQAFRVGEASALAPVDYLRLPMGALAGWWLWGEMPDAPTLVGGAVIVAATLALGRHERRRRT